MTIKRTMLAADIDLNKVKFPAIALPKIDGVQGNIQGGVVLPRSLKQFGNVDFIKRFSDPELNNLNFEITLGDDPTAKNLAHDTAGALRRKDGAFPFHIWVYDFICPFRGYRDRLDKLHDIIDSYSSPIKPFIHTIPSFSMRSREEYLQFRENWLLEGYEGAVLRDPDGKYKHGRATQSSGAFLRDKAKAAFEIRITGFTEAEENKNEKTVNELGLTSRSSHKGNKTAKGIIGSIIGEFIKDTELGGVLFRAGESVKVGAGSLSLKDREHFFNHPDEFLGLIAECECLAYGIKDKPRQPVFKLFRDLIDWDLK